jgi:hypothetical protein
MRYLISQLFVFLFYPILLAQQWQQVGNNLASVSHMYVDRATNELYAGGYYYSPNGDTLCGLVKWNGTNWDLIAEINGDAFFNDIVFYGGNIVVGGIIYPLDHLSQWNGESWSSVCSLPEDMQQFNSISDLHVVNNDLFIAGSFYSVDSVTETIGIVRFDGENWHDLQTDDYMNFSAPDPVEVAQDYNGELYIGGSFVVFGAPYTSNIARWNGQEWTPVGIGLGLQGIYDPVKCMIEYKGSLYIGGNFGPEMFFLNESRYIVRWDGSTYYRLSKDEPCCIKDMVVFKDELYALGTFDEDSEIGSTNIAKWDGTKWCSLGSNLNGTAYDLEVCNDTLYLAGIFTKINGEPIRAVAKWIGGDFVTACSEPLKSVEQNVNSENKIDLFLSPNPATSSVRFQSKSDIPVQVSIYSAAGVEAMQPIEVGPLQSVEMDVSQLPKGAYWARAVSAGGVASQVLIIQ